MSPGSKNKSSHEEKRRLYARSRRLHFRARLVQTIRSYFINRGYLEVETPQLIPSPIPETHIEAFRAEDLYLHTSPEGCMKRLLCANYPKIFQITKCFRRGERGALHLPEFTLLEWYHAGIHYMDLMKECEDLFQWLSFHLETGASVRYGKANVSLSPPWERITVNDAFKRYASVTLKKALENECFDRIMVEDIEPRLGLNRPSFLYDYPASLAALSRLKPDNPDLAERFEIYIAGLELDNGFSELTDPKEQRDRFEKELKLRRHSGREDYPMPERFLDSLEHMPEAAGIALGIDRLTMILTNRARIDDIVSFVPEEL